MNDLFKRYEKRYGYKPTLEEIYSLYTQGELSLSDKEEDGLLKAIEQ